jgi:murein DD-endopeptidase MepM/ murein hydrolase activator NlpD
MMELVMARSWLVLLTVLAMAPATSATPAEKPQIPTVGANNVFTPEEEQRLKGYDIQETGLTPEYPSGYSCSPLTSLYASWIDVDGTRRDTQHSGVDGGHLNDAIVAPAPGIVRRVWVADWGQGHEGALLLVHTREDLNLNAGAMFYYSAFYHLKYDEIKNLKEGQRITRGQQIAHVFRPGGQEIYLPEVHLEVYEVEKDEALTWGWTERGTEYFDNDTNRLIDPLYLLSSEVRPTKHRAPIQPFEPDQNYSAFKGFTYFLPCRRKAEPAD